MNRFFAPEIERCDENGPESIIKKRAIGKSIGLTYEFKPEKAKDLTLMLEAVIRDVLNETRDAAASRALYRSTRANGNETA